MNKFLTDDEPWSNSEVDKMLDLFCAGGSSERISAFLSRTPQAIIREMQLFFRNQNGRADKYIPKQRISRKGKPLTRNETLFISKAVQSGIKPENVARVLSRAANECVKTSSNSQNQADKQSIDKGRQIAPTMDLIWAYHYLFYRSGKRAISDKAYDDLVQEEIEYGGGTNVFKLIKEQDDYPGRIRCLAHYLLLTNHEKEREEQKKL